MGFDTAKEHGHFPRKRIATYHTYPTSALQGKNYNPLELFYMENSMENEKLG